MLLCTQYVHKINFCTGPNLIPIRGISDFIIFVNKLRNQIAETFPLWFAVCLFNFSISSVSTIVRSLYWCVCVCSFLVFVFDSFRSPLFNLIVTQMEDLKMTFLLTFLFLFVPFPSLSICFCIVMHHICSLCICSFVFCHSDTVPLRNGRPCIKILWPTKKP